jgi:hypothetical protein
VADEFFVAFLGKRKISRASPALRHLLSKFPSEFMNLFKQYSMDIAGRIHGICKRARAAKNHIDRIAGFNLTA